MLRRTHWPLLAIILLTGPGWTSAADPQTKPLAARFRRPIALATVDNGRQFLVANRDSGTISRVDIPARRVLDETPIGKRLADMVLAPDGDHLLVADAGGVEGVQHDEQRPSGVRRAESEPARRWAESRCRCHRSPTDAEPSRDAASDRAKFVFRQ